MRPIFTLKNRVRPILLAGLMCGMAGFVHAQLGEQREVGGMGEQGSPAPGESGAFDAPGKKGVTFIEPGSPDTEQDMSISNPGRRTPAMGSTDAARHFIQGDMSMPDSAGRARATRSQSPDAAQQFVPPYGEAVPGQSPFVGGY